MTHRFVALLVVLVAFLGTSQAQESPLTIDQIMQAPETWIGAWPRSLSWAEDGSALYYWWNPEGEFPADSLFKVERHGIEPVRVTPAERREPAPRFSGWQHGSHVYDADFQRKVFESEGDIFIYDRRSGTAQRLTNTLSRESNPRFSADGTSVVFVRDDNLFRRVLSSGYEEQLTDLRRGSEPHEVEKTPQHKYLIDQQAELIEYLRRQRDEREAREASRERDRKEQDLPPVHHYGDGVMSRLELAPGSRFVSFTLSKRGTPPGMTEVHAYVTESGYAENLNARPKVGSPVAAMDLYVQDLGRDTTYLIDLHQLPGSYDVPAYRREMGVEVDSSKTRRQLFVSALLWSGDGHHAVVDVRATDNKTRWIARLDPEDGNLSVIDRQQDDAWIAGPGISSWNPSIGWLPDNRHIYYQSEATGYSHLYMADMYTGQTRQLTSGTFEVFDPELSRDGRTWYFTSSEGSPFERHFYRMDVDGGARTRLSALAGMTDFVLDPQEEKLGMLHSVTTRPPEVYLQDLSRRGRTADARRITHSPTDEWLAYDWRPGEIIDIRASDGVDVPTQIFRPEQPNGAAVLFVHGAGYLQNVHHGWSNYFREFMFHNMLTDLGYTVLNVDFRASAGYGRDWRTAIYRHMGGRDLQDYVDASRYLVTEHDIDPERVFIYGGSYGGFITLMALFNEAQHFGGGAALRSVTDWAHYNHGYTSNILNTPAEDSLAYRRSSPIYFAEGLEDPLLIAHGIVDVNVQFQDVARLAQRLIELRKDDWEMAVYPVEDHGFTEPESWADEYRRILKYIRLSVGPAEDAVQEIPVLRTRE